MTSMASVDACHADLGLAAVPCPDEVLAQLQKVSVATLFQILHRLGFQRTYLTGVSPVIAIPQAVAAQAAEAGLEQELRDTFSRTKVAAGASLSEAFPLNERLRAEYEAWRQQQVT